MECTMSASQIRQASIASLLTRLPSLSVSSNADDRAEALANDGEINIRLQSSD
jgi:hypothetical protein